LFVADQNNHRVQRFTLYAVGAPVGTPLTFGTRGAGDGQLDHGSGSASTRTPSTSPTTAPTAWSISATPARTSARSGPPGPATRNSAAYDTDVDTLGNLYSTSPQ
jgi:hypothetical protein